jgi:hypothetical protein
MIAVDTSVAVPALLPWHESHQSCHAAAFRAAAAAHVMVETYAVLTRLPAGHQLSGHDARQLLNRRFGSQVLVPSARLSRAFVDRIAAVGIAGGASYDALVGLTAAEHDAQLLTRDVRAVPTYEALGVRFRLLDS